ncbi:MAG: Rho termination factor N-terminal domain-containing protein, partial [Mycobacteriales bacterium]
MSDTTDFLTGPAGQDVEPAAPAAAPEPISAPSDADAGAPAADPRPRRRAAGLSGMLLPELQALAGSLGISGVGRMRKGDLITAIQARQSANGAAPAAGQGQLPLGAAPARTQAPARTEAPAAAA